jgi:hypothetical protein
VLIEFHNEGGRINDVFIKNLLRFLRVGAVGFREDDYYGESELVQSLKKYWITMTKVIGGPVSGIMR